MKKNIIKKYAKLYTNFFVGAKTFLLIILEEEKNLAIVM